MTVDELLVYPGRREFAAMPEMDALTEEDAHQEANLLDVRFGFQEASLAMLFDLRVSLRFRPHVGVAVAVATPRFVPRGCRIRRNAAMGGRGRAG